MKTLLILTTLFLASCASLDMNKEAEKASDQKSKQDSKLCKAYVCYIDSIPKRS